METEELGIWYKQNKGWLEDKARYFISTSTWGFENINELISITVEELLHNREKLKVETLKEYTFFVMRSCFYTVFVNKRQVRNSCYDEVLDELYTENKAEYDFERDEKEEKQVEIIYNRVKTENDLMVFDGLLSGNLASKKGKKVKISLTAQQIHYSLNKLKGIPPKKTVYKSTGMLKGRIKKYVDIKATDLQGNIKYYSDLNQVKKDNLTPELVRRCLKGNLKQHKGYTFEYNN